MSTGPCALLMSSVSLVALSVCGSAVLAADLPAKSPMFTKAAALAANPWTWWVEGGLQGVAGPDTYIAGFTPPFATPAKKWGWSGAVAVDYRVDAYWHVSAAFRYGQNKTRSSNSNPLALISTAVATPTAVGTNSADRKETNWVADFMVGRDIGLGLGNSQIKAGLRVAQIRGKTEGSARWDTLATTSGSPTIDGGGGGGAVVASHVTANYQQTNRFLGIGPRVALEGNAPIAGPWSIDYMGGVAALYAHRTVDQTVTTSLTGPFPPVCLAGCPVAVSSSSDGFVFNPDAMIGLSYAFTRNTRLSLNYRVDAYFNALRVVDSANNTTNVNRIYHGPNLRLTVNY